MAKAKMKAADTFSQGGPSGQPNTNASGTSDQIEDSDPLSFVHDSDYVPPHARPPVNPAPVALKKRIAWGPPTTNGSKDQSYAPLPGLGYLWSADATDADPEPVSTAQSTVPAPKSRTNAVDDDKPAPVTSAKPRGVKRGRPRTRTRRKRRADEEEEEEEIGGYDGEDDSDHDLFPKRTKTHTLYINDMPSLLKFYKARFDELTMKPMRKVITEWVSRLEPKRQSKFGRYDNKLPSERSEPSPAWWPSTCPYREPSHLKREHLIPMAADLMMVHRDVDEQAGKRKLPWIAQLRDIAMYIIGSIPAETFSSSRENAFNDSMKDRALKEILPSLFDVAESHEDYVLQYGLFESSGKKDPMKGQYITWKRCPRPYRCVTNKRPRRSKFPQPAQRELPVFEDSGDETEVDETMSAPSTTFSSFQSSASACEVSAREDDFDVKRESTPVNQCPSNTGLNVEMPPSIYEYSRNPQMDDAKPVAATFEVFDRSLNGLHISDSSQMAPRPTGDFQTMQFPRNGADPRYPTFIGMAGPLPSQTPVPFQYAPWPANDAFAHHQSGLPLSGPMEDVQSTNSFQPMQAFSSDFPLPFATNYVYGTHYGMPAPQPPNYEILRSGCHGLPMTMGE